MGQFSEYLYCLAIFTTVAAECLVIAWSATSQRTRLVRGLVAWAAIALLIPVRAYVPALVFTMTAVVAWALAGAICRRQPVAKGNQDASSTWWRFQIADVFVLISVVATIAALLRQVPAIPRITAVVVLPLLGLPLAPILIFAHYAVTGGSRFKMAVATLVALLCSAAFLVWVEVFQHLQITTIIGPQAQVFAGTRYQLTLSILFIACLVACIVVVAWLAINLWSRPPERWKRLVYSLALAATAALGVFASMRYLDELLLSRASDIGVELLWVAAHTIPLMCLALLAAIQAWLMTIDWRKASGSLRLARGIALVAAAVAALPTAWLYWQMARPLPFPSPPVSPTNHFERIMAISKELARNPSLGVGPGTRAHPLVDEAVRLLNEPNFVPTEVLEDVARGVYPPRLTDGELVALPRALDAVAERAESWPDYDRGANYCLAAIRFGEMFHRGGTNSLAGWLYQSPAVNWLKQNRGQVSHAKAREVLRETERLLVARDDLDTLLERERIVWVRKMGWAGRLKYRLAGLVGGDYLVLSPADNYLASLASLRGLQTMFAIRLFQEENHRLPRDLSELVPVYLPTLPLDPYSQQPIIYRSAPDDFELFSVGRDRMDNGGKFNINGDYGPAGLDLDLTWK